MLFNSCFALTFCSVWLCVCCGTAQELPFPLVLQSKEFLLKQRAELRAMSEPPLQFDVQQTIELTEIPQNTAEVKIWIALPSDAEHQKLLGMNIVSIPGRWGIVEDADRRGRFLQVSVEKPNTDALKFQVQFSLRRSPVLIEVDTDRVSPLNDLEKSLLKEHLDRHSLHMEVTDKVQQIADDVCGEETNAAIQALAIMKHIAAKVDHYSYSKDPDMPRCGVGDAQNCLSQGGGCCTDLNSLFIALARARGIPARLQMGYRLLPENEGKLVDPGYRCWVEYFVPAYGWISADVVEADRPDGQGEVRWLTGLTANRIWLNQGRNFRFKDTTVSEPINHMNIAYAEIDGKPARLLPEGDSQPQIQRKVIFTTSRTHSSDR